MRFILNSFRIEAAVRKLRPYSHLYFENATSITPLQSEIRTNKKFCFAIARATIKFGVRQYHDLLGSSLRNGRDRTDRTGTGTLSVFGAQTRFDLRNDGPGFPLLTTKKVAHQIDHLRAALVLARRHEYSVLERARRHHLG
jgi:hypothetical protein